jgi:hypothetical protein
LGACPGDHVATVRRYFRFPDPILVGTPGHHVLGKIANPSFACQPVRFAGQITKCGASPRFLSV